MGYSFEGRLVVLCTGGAGLEAAAEAAAAIL